VTVRILIADDHGVLRAGLRALLNAEPDLQVVGEAADCDEAVRLSGVLCPDVVLMDISMPGPGGGIEAARRLKELLPDTCVLILTAHEDKGLLREAIRAGAAGYIPKVAAESELVNAIRAVARGDLYVHSALTRALLADAAQPSTGGAVGAEPLSPREIEVLRLVARGFTNRQVAEALNLSVRTVESHRANLMDKLGLHSRVELVRYASEHKLLE